MNEWMMWYSKIEENEEKSFSLEKVKIEGYDEIYSKLNNEKSGKVKNEGYVEI